jgi:hypothetical protein
LFDAALEISPEPKTIAVHLCAGKKNELMSACCQLPPLVQSLPKSGATVFAILLAKEIVEILIANATGTGGFRVRPLIATPAPAYRYATR